MQETTEAQRGKKERKCQAHRVHDQQQNRACKCGAVASASTADRIGPRHGLHSEANAKPNQPCSYPVPSQNCAPTSLLCFRQKCLLVCSWSIAALRATTEWNKREEEK